MNEATETDSTGAGGTLQRPPAEMNAHDKKGRGFHPLRSPEPAPGAPSWRQALPKRPLHLPAGCAAAFRARALVRTWGWVFEEDVLTASPASQRRRKPGTARQAR
jgi:hypothetical protein